MTNATGGMSTGGFGGGGGGGGVGGGLGGASSGRTLGAEPPSTWRRIGTATWELPDAGGWLFTWRVRRALRSGERAAKRAVGFRPKGLAQRLDHPGPHMRLVVRVSARREHPVPIGATAFRAYCEGVERALRSSGLEPRRLDGGAQS